MQPIPFMPDVSPVDNVQQNYLTTNLTLSAFAPCFRTNSALLLSCILL